MEKYANVKTRVLRWLQVLVPRGTMCGYDSTVADPSFTCAGFDTLKSG